jgi:hypothetical protein
MCMKTNKTTTKCPKRNGHFRLSFGHFRQTDTNFTEFRGEFTVATIHIDLERPTRTCGNAVLTIHQSPSFQSVRRARKSHSGSPFLASAILTSPFPERAKDPHRKRRWNGESGDRSQKSGVRN